MNPTTIQAVAAALFALALIHTFSTKFFEHLAHTRPAHAGVWHLLAEVEIVFGVWAMLFMAVMGAIEGFSNAMAYLDGRNFTEPLFVFAIMVIAATRPILQASMLAVHATARLLPLPGGRVHARRSCGTWNPQAVTTVGPAGVVTLTVTNAMSSHRFWPATASTVPPVVSA